MILYIASFPRSGNSWVAQILRNRFRLLTTDIHADQALLEAHAARHVSEQGYHGFADLGLQDGDIGIPVWKQQSTDPPGPVQLLPMAPLTPLFEDIEFRRKLAEHNTCFVVKTHLAPYDTYLEGEFVLQPIRHPGGSTWSYYHFLRDMEGHDFTQEEVIKGTVGFGNWSKFHENWNRIRDTIGERFYRVRYEDIFDAEHRLADQISGKFGLPVLSTTSVPFAHLHAAFPLLARSGKAEAWRDHFSDEQVQILIECHGPQMNAFGYSAEQGQPTTSPSWLA